MTTIKDVSNLAKVSISTVSRVINNTAQVAPEKREAVLQAMEQLNYRPNSFAQALVSKRSDCIGLLVGDLGGGPFFVQMMNGIEQVVEQAKKFSMVMSGRHEAQRERECIEFLLQRQCDALILHSKGLSDEELQELAAGETPLVIINRLVPGLEEQCVYLDNLEGAAVATQYLIDQGHQKIAFITTDDEEFVDGRERMEGYKSTLKAAGIECNPALVRNAFPNEEGGSHAMRDLLESGEEFTAVFGFNDAMVAGAISVLREEGVQIPQEVSVVGFDDIMYARFVHPKLTTVRYPIQEMGARAAELALAMLDKRTIDQEELCFHPKLIERESVQAK